MDVVAATLKIETSVLFDEVVVAVAADDMLFDADVLVDIVLFDEVVVVAFEDVLVEDTAEDVVLLVATVDLLPKPYASNLLAPPQYLERGLATSCVYLTCTYSVALPLQTREHPARPSGASWESGNELPQ